MESKQERRIKEAIKRNHSSGMREVDAGEKEKYAREFENRKPGMEEYKCYEEGYVRLDEMAKS